MTEPTSKGPLADIAPELQRLTDGILFGEVWERGEPSRRDRALVTVAP